MESIWQPVFVLVLLGVFASIAWKRTDFGVYGVIFGLPFYLLQFKVMDIPTTVLEDMIYVLTIIVLAKKMVVWKTFSVNLSRNFWLGSGICLLLLGVTISTVFSVDLRTSAGIWKGWFIDPVLFFFVLGSVIKKEEQVKCSFYALLLSGFSVALLGMLYWLMPAWGGITYDNRLRAFYLSANHLAMYLAPALLAAFGFAVFSDELKKKVIFAAVFLAIATPLYLTNSYSAMLGVTAALVFFSAVVWQRLAGAGNKLVFPFAALFLVLMVVFTQAKTEKFQSVFNFSYPSIVSRTVIWQASADILKNHWLAGIGPGTFQEYYLKNQSKYPPYPEWAVPEPHNIFLAFWLQTGILGLAGFLLILAWFFKAGLGAIFKHEIGSLVSQLAILSLTAMVYTLVHGLTDTPYWKNDLAAIFWIVAGLVYVLENQRGKTKVAG